MALAAADVGWTDRGEQDAEAWLASYDLKVQQAKVLVQQELGTDTAVVVRLLKQQFTRYSSPSMAEVFYGDLGVRPAYSSPHGAVYNEPISLEQLSAMKVDCIFLMVCQESETLSVWEDVQKTSLWQNIKAVQNNRLYIITADPWLENSLYPMNEW